MRILDPNQLPRSAQSPSQRSTNPFLFILAGVGALTLLVMAALAFAAVMAWKSVGDLAARSSFGGFSESRSAKTPESYFHDTSRGKKLIAGIRLEGEIDSLAAEEVIEKLEAAADHRDVAGIFLEVNSPGGAVVASQEMYDAIKETRTVKPVYAHVREVAASGAYYAMAAAERISVNRSSMVGSIGVILSAFDATELFAWAKLKPKTLKTGKLKDAGSESREWTPEDAAFLQKLIDDTHAQFEEDVRTARDLPPETMRRMADGRVVLGTEAVALKLVDEILTKNQAVEALATKVNAAGDYDFEYMEAPPKFESLLERFFTGVTSKAASDAARAFAGELKREARERTLPRAE